MVVFNRHNMTHRVLVHIQPCIIKRRFANEWITLTQWLSYHTQGRNNDKVLSFNLLVIHTQCNIGLNHTHTIHIQIYLILTLNLVQKDKLTRNLGLPDVMLNFSHRDLFSRKSYLLWKCTFLTTHLIQFLFECLKRIIYSNNRGMKALISSCKVLNI